MADSLLFAGSPDRREFTQGQVAGTGALSSAMIVKRTGADGGTAEWSWCLRFQNFGADSYPLGFRDTGLAGTNLLIRTFNGTDEPSADPTLATVLNEWYLIGASKAAGTATPRYHIYRYSTATWEHGNFNATMGNFTAPEEVIVWVGTSTESLVGNLLIGAIWDSQLADGVFETLAFDKPSWVTAAPDEAYRFDTAGAMTPFVGTGTAGVFSGGTLDVGDAPVGWSDTEPASTAIVGTRRVRTSRGTSW